MKTLCKVDDTKSFSESKATCESSAMQLADSSEHLDSLKAFANLYGYGGYIWVDGGNGCTLLIIPFGSSTYSKSVNQACYLDYISICEYDSKAEKLYF